MIGSIWAWGLGILIPWVALAALAVFFGSNLWKTGNKDRYSCLTMFPYELWGGEKEKRRVARVFLYAFCIYDAFAHSYPLLFQQLHSSLLGIVILMLAVAVGRAIALAAMVTVPAYEFKPHLLSFVLYGALGALEAALLVIFFANRTSDGQVLCLVFAGIEGLLGMGMIGIMSNPKLGQWTRMNAVVDQDGNIVTSRPKPFVLAFSEWLLLLLNFIMTASALVGCLALFLIQQ